jgi:hypothetical protein
MRSLETFCWLISSLSSVVIDVIAFFLLLVYGSCFLLLIVCIGGKGGRRTTVLDMLGGARMLGHFEEWCNKLNL